MVNKMTSRFEEVVQVPIGEITLEGGLFIPKDAVGIVLFAHGSGSSRFSPRNQYVARFLNEHKLGTLLIDLLTEREGLIDEETRALRFDIELLANRLSGVTDWLLKNPKTHNLAIGYFGSSTGAAAALIAAAKHGRAISAVVSRGGRADLAGKFLPKVLAPTLLIVGGDDTVVIELNEQAFELMNCEKKLEIVPGATHLFEEPGTLEEVARLAGAWFVKHLAK